MRLIKIVLRDFKKILIKCKFHFFGKENIATFFIILVSKRIHFNNSARNYINEGIILFLRIRICDALLLEYAKHCHYMIICEALLLLFCEAKHRLLLFNI